MKKKDKESVLLNKIEGDQKLFLFQYTHQGKVYGSYLYAKDHQDAEEVLQSIQDTAMLQGAFDSQLPASVEESEFWVNLTRH